MFDRMDALKRWLTLQALVKDDAPVQEKIHQMMSEAGLHDYCFVEEVAGWTIRPMTEKELSDFKLARVQDGDMLTVQPAPFLSEVVRGPVELHLDRDEQVKILVPSFQRRPGMIIIHPLSIRTIHRDGKVVAQFLDERMYPMFYQIQGFELFYRVLSAFWQAQREQHREQSVARFMYARGVTEIHFPGQPEEERLFLRLADHLQVPVHATTDPVVFNKEFL